MDTQTDKIIARIRSAIEAGATPRSLALRAGLNRNTLYGADKDGWNPSANTMRALEVVLRSDV